MLEKLPIAFLAGLVSVVTPCVLPLVPGYLSAVSAVEVERARRARARHGGSCVASVPFILGFTVVFVAARRRRGGDRQHRRQAIADRDRRASCSSCSASRSWGCCRGRSVRSRRGCCSTRADAARASLLGGAFAVCAAPCIGTVLASILVLRVERDDRARRRPARRVLARARRRLRRGGRRVRARDARVPLGARPLHASSRSSQARRSSCSACCSSSTATGGCGSRSTRCSRGSASARSSAVAQRPTSRPRCAGSNAAQPAQRLHALALGGDRLAAPALVGRDDDVDEPLEEVALLGIARAPRSSNASCASKYAPRAREREPVVGSHPSRC